MKMNEPKVFWKDHFNGFVNRIFSFPFDNSPLNNINRSGRESTITLQLSEDEVTLFQLGLSTFDAFLFKLMEESDLCVLTVSVNRPRSELEEIVSFFVNTLPHRLLIDPQWNLPRLLEHVRQFFLTLIFPIRKSFSM